MKYLILLVTLIFGLFTMPDLFAERLNLDLNNYTIDGASASTKIDQAKTGNFLSVSHVEPAAKSGGDDKGCYFKEPHYVDPQCCSCSLCYSVCPVDSTSLEISTFPAACCTK